MRTLVEFGLANALAATLLAIVALAVGAVVRRPAVRNALWLLVLVRLIVPPMWSVPVAWPASWGVADSPVEMLQMMPGFDFMLNFPVQALTRFGRWDQVLNEPTPPKPELFKL